MSTDEKAKTEKFLKLFFLKYATAKKQELLLLMKKPIDTIDHMEFLEFNKNESKRRTRGTSIGSICRSNHWNCIY
ncbi:hypothetical protein [Enterococcus durans]|uniref:hypothetical protein n=1 Tax=Enterococcus durans TaxID=53345 RepID=UPI00292A5DB5|nr:hypothetical protein [Enterococcus durans]